MNVFLIILCIVTRIVTLPSRVTIPELRVFSPSPIHLRVTSLTTLIMTHGHMMSNEKSPDFRNIEIGKTNIIFVLLICKILIDE